MKKIWTLTLFFIIKTIDGFLYAFIGPFMVLYIIPHFLMNISDYPAIAGFGQRWLEIIGSYLMWGGALLALLCTIYMFFFGKGSPLVTSPPKKLVISGIFAYIRHPMMWSLLVVILGEAIFFGSYLILVWLVAWARIGHLIVVKYEEPQMEHRFGAEYKEYCSKVPRWIPKFKNYVIK